jgi:hypothetical protein
MSSYDTPLIVKSSDEFPSGMKLHESESRDTERKVAGCADPHVETTQHVGELKEGHCQRFPAGFLSL